MRTRFLTRSLAMASLLLAASTYAGDSFSYQGLIENNGTRANGDFDFEFKLFDDPGAGAQVGSTFLADDLTVADGLFSATLDFGSSIFDGSTLYLEIGVRPGVSTGTYTTLSGRVPLQSVPHAHVATNANQLDGRPANDFAEASHDHNLQDLSGAVTDAQVPDDITVNQASDADTLDGIDSTAFAPSSHTHSMLASPDGLMTDVVTTDNAGDTFIKRNLQITANGPVFSAPDSTTVDIDLGKGISLQVTEDNDRVTVQSEGTGLSIRTPNEPTSGSVDVLEVRAGNGPLGGAGDGGDIDIRSGSGGGIFSGAGGDGGDISLTASDANGSGDNSGGSVTIAPGAGANAGDNGRIVLLDEVLIVFDFASGPIIPFPLPRILTVGGAMSLDGQFIDANGSPGSPGEVLSSTGDDTEWINISSPDGHSLNSPDGQLTDVVAVDNAGDTFFKGDIKFGNDGNIGTNNSNDLVLNATNRVKTGSSLSLENDEFIQNSTDQIVDLKTDGLDSTFRFQFNSDMDTIFQMGSGEGGQSTIRATSSGIISNDNAESLRLEAGSAAFAGTGTGGQLSLFAGNGAQSGFGGATAGGDGGPVVIEAGDAGGVAINDGGNIFIVPGSGVNGGSEGILVLSGDIAAGTVSVTSGRKIDTDTGAFLSDSGVWTDNSSRERKTDFENVDTSDVLNRVLELPVLTWRYKVDENGTRHMGPVAEEFSQQFGLGDSDEHIASLDSTGVALAAIQGLHNETNTELENLKAENEELKQRLEKLEALLGNLLSQEGGN